MITQVGAALKAGTDRATGNAAQVSSDQFLRLLVTQLQNQDPLSPLSSEEFITQMAQFQMLEEMMETSQNTGSTMLGARLSLAGGLIGRVVTAETADGLLVTGVVDRVIVEDGEPSLIIGNEMISLDSVTEVF